MNGRRTIFLTGVTGFIGQTYINSLASHLEREGVDFEFVVLARDSIGTPYDQRVKLKPGTAERTFFVKGDVTEPGFGMSDKDLRRVQQANEAWHMAASTDFFESKREQIFSINRDGVKHLVEILQGAPNLEEYFHVSTAYVAGTREAALEDELVPPPSFRNPYEESKHEGEKIVRASGLPFIVLRPSIVVGDLTTGVANTHKMIYGVLNTFAGVKKRAIRHGMEDSGEPVDLGLVVHARHDTTKNYLSCDELNVMMLAVRERCEIGRTYHLTNPNPSTFGALVDSIAKFLGIKNVAFSGTFERKGASKNSILLNKGLREYLPYFLIDDPVFDRENMDRIRAGFEVTDLDKPRLPEGGISALDFLVLSYIREYHPDKLFPREKEKEVSE